MALQNPALLKEIAKLYTANFALKNNKGKEYKEIKVRNTIPRIYSSFTL